MISRRALLFSLPSLAFMKSQAQSPSQKALRLVYHPDVPPFSFQSPNHSSTQGILPDLANTLAAPMNLMLSHQAYPWGRAQWMVETGVADAFCCPITPKRQSYAIFAPTPIITLHDPVFFYSRLNPNAEAVKTAKRKEDFYALRTATFLGNSSHDHIWGDHPHVEKVANVDQILKMLELGRIDFYFADPLVTGYKIKQVGLSGVLESAPLGHLVSKGQETKMRFGLRHSYPNSEKVIDKIDKTINRVITSELRKHIVGQYIS